MSSVDADADVDETSSEIGSDFSCSDSTNLYSSTGNISFKHN